MVQERVRSSRATPQSDRLAPDCSASSTTSALFNEVNTAIQNPDGEESLQERSVEPDRSQALGYQLWLWL